MIRDRTKALNDKFVTEKITIIKRFIAGGNIPEREKNMIGAMVEDAINEIAIEMYSKGYEDCMKKYNK